MQRHDNVWVVGYGSVIPRWIWIVQVVILWILDGRAVVWSSPADKYTNAKFVNQTNADPRLEAFEWLAFHSRQSSHTRLASTTNGPSSPQPCQPPPTPLSTRHPPQLPRPNLVSPIENPKIRRKLPPQLRHHA